MRLCASIALILIEFSGFSPMETTPIYRQWRNVPWL